MRLESFGTHTQKTALAPPLFFPLGKSQIDRRTKTTIFFKRIHLCPSSTHSSRTILDILKSTSSNGKSMGCDPHRRVEGTPNQVDERGRTNKNGRKWRRAGPDRRMIKFISWSTDTASCTPLTQLTTKLHDYLRPIMDLSKSRQKENKITSHSYVG